MPVNKVNAGELYPDVSELVIAVGMQSNADFGKIRILAIANGAQE